MYPYTYRAYWREQGATTWNVVESPTPITWNQEIIQGVAPVYPFTGGQCPKFYRAIGAVSWGRYVCSTGQVFLAEGLIGTDFNLLGPIGNLRVRTIEPGQCGNTAVQVLVSTGNDPNRQIYYSKDVNFRAAINFRVNSLVFEPQAGTDNCGNPPPTTPGVPGECKTTFSTGLIVSRPQCIEVTLAPPECPCCAQLLSRANAILARL